MLDRVFAFGTWSQQISWGFVLAQLAFKNNWWWSHYPRW